MKKASTILLISAVACAAQADTETQVVNFSHGFEGEIVSFQMFDTMDGARELTGLTLSYDQSLTLDLHVESNGYTAVSNGDWFLDVGFNSLHQFGTVDEGGDGGPNPPFIGPGAIFGSISADLGASDGYNGTGPDTYSTSITDSYVFEASYDASTEFGLRMFEAFSGQGTLETFFGGFSEAFGGWINDPNWVVDPNNPPEGPFDIFTEPYYGFFLTFDDFVHEGTITVTYEYTNVPTPSGAALLGLGGLVAMRRRR